jgi:hypothetical protein
MRFNILTTAFIIVAISFVCPLAQSQTTIKTITALKQKSSYPFSHEWQYLSSDLYLLNAQKFSDLLNDIASLNSNGKRRRKKLGSEKLQSLFIKANIKNLKFFGGDVVYPIYSFRVSEIKISPLLKLAT